MAIARGGHMNMDTQSCFALQPLDTVIVGGTNLGDEFLAILTESNAPCHLRLASAFITDSIVSKFSYMNHRTTTIDIVTRPGASFSSAEKIASSYPWKSAQVRFSAKLHAKLFILVRDDMSGAFMVGSHNLTRRGTSSNHEVGVLFRTQKPRGMMNPLFTALDQFQQIWSQSHFPLTVI
jgi:hypothetical protein